MNYTVEEWRKASSRTAASRLNYMVTHWEIVKPTYEEWVDVIERAVIDLVDKIVRRRNNVHEMNEDQITTLVIVGLEQLSLDVSSKVVNGNCDLAVEYDDYLWLAEAKIASDNSTIYGGYLQLTQRYAPGASGNSSGAMLLYCKDTALAVMNGWKDALKTGVEGADVRDSEWPLAFRSTAISDSSGLPIQVLHVGFALKYAPQEDTVKLPPAALEAGRVTKAAVKKIEGIG